jgi:phosphoglycolate phosphatase-like HAD superfamily hydrolase
MKSFTGVKNILWDFDGVIMNSMPVRDKGFEVILKQYPSEQVEELMLFHRLNGGLSRYVKFRHFFEVIRKESITEDEILILASSFSEIMLEELLNPSLLIQDSLSFIKENAIKYNMHVVSGSDEKELKHICNELNLSDFFRSIKGSPTTKIINVGNLISENGYKHNETLLIGDSINDAEAAQANKIRFCGYNNANLCDYGYEYINSFNTLK